MYSTTSPPFDSFSNHWSNAKDSNESRHPKLIKAMEETAKEIDERLDENGCLTIEIF